MTKYMEIDKQRMSVRIGRKGKMQGVDKMDSGANCQEGKIGNLGVGGWFNGVENIMVLDGR